MGEHLTSQRCPRCLGFLRKEWSIRHYTCKNKCRNEAEIPTTPETQPEAPIYPMETETDPPDDHKGKGTELGVTGSKRKRIELGEGGLSVDPGGQGGKRAVTGVSGEGEVVHGGGASYEGDTIFQASGTRV